MKKIIAIGLLVLCNPVLHAQEYINKEIDKLFFNLKVASGPKGMVAGSDLNFETFIQDDPESGDKTKILLYEFTKNKMIDSKIINGELQIIQKNSEIENKVYEVTQKIELQSLKDVIHEYEKLSSPFEKSDFSISEVAHEITDKNEGYQNKVIRMITKSQRIVLTFMYPYPISKTDQTEYKYDLFIICKFWNL